MQKAIAISGGFGQVVLIWTAFAIFKAYNEMQFQLIFNVKSHGQSHSFCETYAAYIGYAKLDKESKHNLSRFKNDRTSR